MTESLKQTTVLVTGANRGMGLELSRLLTEEGATVIAVCREVGAALPELDVEIIEGVDVTSAEAVSRLAKGLDGRRLDWLVNNAGILERDSLDALDFDSIERQFRVNTLGPLRVVAALRRNLARGSKIFVTTSAMGSISDNSSGGYYGYRISKAGVNMAFKRLSEDLRGEGIGVFMLHPGFVATDMTAGRGDVQPEVAARGLIERMKELDLSRSGTFRHARGHDLAW